MTDKDGAVPPPLTPLEPSFRIRVTMQSDWRVGSGTGRPGEVDRLVRRDDNDLPFIPAKTLTGIWRDACERVALGLDDGQAGAWSRWVSFLFGEQPGQPKEELISKTPDDYRHPRPAALSLRSAHLPQPLTRALASNSRVAAREAVTFLKPGVKIDSRSGRAAEKHLRFEEMGRMGAVLEADCAIDWGSCGDDCKVAATALLVAATKLVERIGGKRRRGAGRCTMVITDFPEIERALLVLESRGEPPEAPSHDLETCTLSFEPSTGDWLRYSLEIITRSPVVVPTRTVGNQVETADYLPGTYLLPILRRKLAHTQANWNAAIVNAGVIITNATVSAGGKGGRPTPFAICHEKLGGGFARGKGVYNRLCDVLDFKQKTPQVKNYKEGYVGPSAHGKLPAHTEVRRAITTHNVVCDSSQRPEEGVGGVYSYESITAGQEFHAELRLRSSLVEKIEQADPEWLKSLLGQHRIGRSKKDEYGVIEVKRAAPISDRDVTRVGEQADGADDKLLTVWLLSDLLLRDERLRPTASIEHLRKELEETGLKLAIRESHVGQPRSAAIRQKRLESWQVAWKRPRPTLAGLAAGSCVVFEIKEGALDERMKAALARLETEGLGKRCSEGYGQIRFNDPLLTGNLEGATAQIEIVKPSTPAELLPLVAGSDTFEYARLIEREAVRRDIERRSLHFADSRDNRDKAFGMTINAANVESQPPLSQLSALRSGIRRLGSQTDKDEFNDWLNRLEGTRNRAEKWKESDTGSLKKIRNLINNSDCVWTFLDVPWKGLIITESGQKDIETELWAEAVRALVDACVRGQKREVERLQQARQGGY